MSPTEDKNELLGHSYNTERHCVNIVYLFRELQYM